jgi:hypothetical protein
VKRPSKSPKLPPPPDEPAPKADIGAGHAPSLATIVAATFLRLNFRMRARMLGRLLASVGPLAMTVVGGGAFAKYVVHARWQEIPVSIEDAARATSGQIYDIVRYVQQSNPQLYGQLLDVLARDTATITALGASIAALTVNRIATRGRAGQKARYGIGGRAGRRKPASNS